MDPLKIRRNRIVHVSLQVVDIASGDILEDTEQSGQHFVYLQGHGNLVPEVEQTLQGLVQGDSFEVDVSLPFGDYLPDVQRTFRRDEVELPPNCHVGQSVTTIGPNGHFEVVVKAVDKDTVTLDANHPLAGRSLRYTGVVQDVQRAHKDEIRHHRPHPAGHHLMVHDSSFDDKII